MAPYTRIVWKPIMTSVAGPASTSPSTDVPKATNIQTATTAKPTAPLQAEADADPVQSTSASKKRRSDEDKTENHATDAWRHKKSIYKKSRVEEITPVPVLVGAGGAGGESSSRHCNSNQGTGKAQAHASVGGRGRGRGRGGRGRKGESSTSSCHSNPPSTNPQSKKGKSKAQITAPAGGELAASLCHRDPLGLNPHSNYIPQSMEQAPIPPPSTVAPQGSGKRRDDNEDVPAVFKKYGLSLPRSSRVLSAKTAEGILPLASTTDASMVPPSTVQSSSSVNASPMLPALPAEQGFVPPSIMKPWSIGLDFLLSHMIQSSLFPGHVGITPGYIGNLLKTLTSVYGGSTMSLQTTTPTPSDLPSVGQSSCSALQDTSTSNEAVSVPDEYNWYHPPLEFNNDGNFTAPASCVPLAVTPSSSKWTLDGWKLQTTSTTEPPPLGECSISTPQYTYTSGGVVYGPEGHHSYTPTFEYNDYDDSPVIPSSTPFVQSTHYVPHAATNSSYSTLIGWDDSPPTNEKQALSSSSATPTAASPTHQAQCSNLTAAPEYKLNELLPCNLEQLPTPPGSASSKEIKESVLTTSESTSFNKTSEPLVAAAIEVAASSGQVNGSLVDPSGDITFPFGFPEDFDFPAYLESFQSTPLCADSATSGASNGSFPATSEWTWSSVSRGISLATNEETALGGSGSLGEASGSLPEPFGEKQELTALRHGSVSPFGFEVNPGMNDRVVSPFANVEGNLLPPDYLLEN